MSLSRPRKWIIFQSKIKFQNWSKFVLCFNWKIFFGVVFPLLILKKRRQKQAVTIFKKKSNDKIVSLTSCRVLTQRRSASQPLFCWFILILLHNLWIDFHSISCTMCSFRIFHSFECESESNVGTQIECERLFLCHVDYGLSVFLRLMHSIEFVSIKWLCALYKELRFFTQLVFCLLSLWSIWIDKMQIWFHGQWQNGANI